MGEGEEGWGVGAGGKYLKTLHDCFLMIILIVAGILYTGFPKKIDIILNLYYRENY